MSSKDTSASQGLLPDAPSPPFSPSPPQSPLIFPDADAPPPRPSFSRRLRSTASHRRRSSLTPSPPFTEELLRKAKILQDKALSLWASATLTQRILFVTLYIFFTTIGILFIVYSESLFAALAPVAVKWRALPGGWLISFALIFITAFPPVIGYTTALTIAGFVYGMKGWFICASANVIGSYCSFIASRTVLSKYVHRLVGEDKRFEAFASILKHDGIKVLVMIRFCPLPYSISNGAMSTLPTVHPLAFTAATAMATPKLLIHVFAGSRLAAIAEAGSEMDRTTKIVNYVSMAVFGILGAVLGYVIYRRTMARALELEAEEVGDTGGYGGASWEEGDEEEQVGLADPVGFDEDDISLWDNDDAGYRDDWTDEETRVENDDRR
ncbi:Tlg2-vesicle protein [Pseudogymnoascus australis]